MGRSIELRVSPSFALKLIWHLWRGIIGSAWLWATGARELNISLSITNVVISPLTEK